MVLQEIREGKEDISWAAPPTVVTSEALVELVGVDPAGRVLGGRALRERWIDAEQTAPRTRLHKAARRVGSSPTCAYQ